MRITAANHKLVRRDNDGDYSHSEASTEVTFDLDEGESFGEAIGEISSLLVEANKSSIELQRHTRAKARTAMPPPREEPRQVQAPRGERREAPQTLGEECGALWLGENSKGKPCIKGNIFDQKIYIDNSKPGELKITQPGNGFEEVGTLNDVGGRFVGICEGQAIVCVKNAKKKAKTHPDYKVHIVEGDTAPNDGPMGDSLADDDDVPF